MINCVVVLIHMILLMELFRTIIFIGRNSYVRCFILSDSKLCMLAFDMRIGLRNNVRISGGNKQVVSDFKSKSK